MSLDPHANPSSSDTALAELQRVVDLLVQVRMATSTRYAASAAAEDPNWDTPGRTRHYVAELWSRLQERVTAEIGSALSRQVADWNVDYSPSIVVGQPDDFKTDWADDEPYGWLPLAKAHCQESGWDFGPSESSGTWIGWFEPESAVTMGGSATDVFGVLTAFIVVHERTLKFAHVVHRRRRSGVASRLVEYAVRHHALTSVDGPLSEDGAALVSALQRRGLLL